MNFIVAVDNNWAIGKNNGLLYSIKKDMEYFKNITLGKIVVMGEATLKSFPGSKPLKNRTNIVLSNNPNFVCENSIVMNSIEMLFEQIKKYNGDDVFVIGGASIYNQLIPFCKYGYITMIDAEEPADKYITNIERLDNWKLIEKSKNYYENNLNFTFNKYENTLL